MNKTLKNVVLEKILHWQLEVRKDRICRISDLFTHIWDCSTQGKALVLLPREASTGIAHDKIFPVNKISVGRLEQFLHKPNGDNYFYILSNQAWFIYRCKILCEY